MILPLFISREVLSHSNCFETIAAEDPNGKYRNEREILTM